eukprot:4721404-Prymnesium_polylepis.1
MPRWATVVQLGHTELHIVRKRMAIQRERCERIPGEPIHGRSKHRCCSIAVCAPPLHPHAEARAVVLSVAWIACKPPLIATAVRTHP